jgi:hypothetical protein
MYFPITIIDDFHKRFEEIKLLANSLDFFNKTIYTMPGKETKELYETNYDYFLHITRKLLSVFYSRDKIDDLHYTCITKFEKIIPYGSIYNKEGWIHTDDLNILSAIYYIQGNYSEGTSFYKKKKIGQPDYSPLRIKERLYKGEKLEPNFYNSELKKFNNEFEEILKVPLIPNRIVIFDSSIYHKSDGLGTLESPRLIQTFFFREIKTGLFPLNESNRI